MFLHPVEYGRKAEELLWRKVYYDVIHLVKTARKERQGCGSLDCAYRTHLTAGVGFYQHLLLSLQEQYWLQLQGCVDWLHLGDTLAGALDGGHQMYLEVCIGRVIPLLCCNWKEILCLF